MRWRPHTLTCTPTSLRRVRVIITHSRFLLQVMPSSALALRQVIIISLARLPAAVPHRLLQPRRCYSRLSPAAVTPLVSPLCTRVVSRTCKAHYCRHRDPLDSRLQGTFQCLRITSGRRRRLPLRRMSLSRTSPTQRRTFTACFWPECSSVITSPERVHIASRRQSILHNRTGGAMTRASTT